MSTETRQKLDPCGCCEAAAAATPVAIWNRPSRSRIDYRVGTYASFRRAMVESIAGRPELQGWTTRASEDYGIALVEMWAYVADILTFYHDRAMNEAFLRTALHRESVLRLAALLGYELGGGVAAAADLAFTVEDGKTVQIPVGLRVQSVPGQGEKPQKFEAVEKVKADARLNRARVFPQPEKHDPFAKGSTGGILDPSSAAKIAAGVAVGDQIVVAGDGLVGDETVEEKEVTGLKKADGRTVLTWSPEIRKSLKAGRCFKWRRKLQLFGHDAPEEYLKPATKGGQVTWEEWKTQYGVPKGDTLELDAIYDLKVGSRILISVSKAGATAGEKHVFVRRIIGVAETPASITAKKAGKSRKVLGATVSRITLDSKLPAPISDRRRVVLYELAEPEIDFWKWTYGKIAKGSASVCVPLDKLSTLAPGRTLILDDKNKKPQTVAVSAAAQVDADGDWKNDHLAISFTPALTRDLHAATAVLYGNVAEATHGETVSGEVLGSGDASKDFQSFKLSKSPVTFVSDASASRGAKNTLQVRVDGVRWQELGDLYGQKPDARVYTTRLDDDGEMTVLFGDGRTGARLPTGSNNLLATYRQGLGLAGRLAAGQLTTLLDRPSGLESVTNPAKASGGADPETLATARKNVPNTVRTLGRIISLRDFEDAAREYAGVAKARAAWKWDGGRRVVQLAVAGDGGAVLGAAGRRKLAAYLDARRDRNREMRLRDYRKAPILIALAIEADADYLPQKVRKAVREKLAAAFAFDRVELGQPVQLSDLYRIVQGVDGVAAADVDWLIWKPQGWSWLWLLWHLKAQFPVLFWGVLGIWLHTEWPAFVDRLRRRGARFSGSLPDALQPRLLLDPDELAGIEVPATDLLVSVRKTSS